MDREWARINEIEQELEAVGSQDAQWIAEIKRFKKSGWVGIEVEK